MREVNTIFKLLVKRNNSFTVEHEFDTFKEVLEFAEITKNEGK